MLALIKLAAFGAAGYYGYRWLAAQGSSAPAAFASGQGSPGNFAQVRDSGPEAMASSPQGWSKTDEASDQSFPASDPPANY